MDLHPIIVHIPIAFLAVYAGLEVLTVIPKLRASLSFFNIKAFLLLVGTLGAIVATISGENAEHLNAEFLNKNLVHIHSEYGEMTRNLFIILLLIYACLAIATYIDKKAFIAKLSTGLANTVEKVGGFFKKYYIITILLAIVGLGLVSITGALGGALVYGTDAKDPFIVFTVKHVCGAECK